MSATLAEILSEPARFPHVHMLGIGGIGMAGLAQLLKANGFTVTGCDAEASRRTAALEQSGIPVAIGHHPAHLTPDTDWAIFSPAVPQKNTERHTAVANGIPLFRRGEVLPLLARRYETTAVAGTHGKTTTSAMVLHIHRTAAAGASWCIGGEIPPDGLPGGTAGPRLIIEADESDGTLSNYHVQTAILTNIEPDHMEHFRSHAELLQCFRLFLRQAQQHIVCADDPAAAALGRDFNAIRYGLQADTLHTTATGITIAPAGITYTLRIQGTPCGTFQLPLLGTHNLSNALAAITAAGLAGIPHEAAARALETFTLPRRRFEHIASKNGITLLGDYAHHPGEIRALLAAAKQAAAKRILAVFQPHRYTRTLALRDDFPPAFTAADHVLLLPVYAASEPPLPGGTSADLAQYWRALPGVPPVEETPDFQAATARLSALWQPGDLILLIGAGDIETLGPLLAARL